MRWEGRVQPGHRTSRRTARTTKMMWSAWAISRSTWTSAGHGESDRLMDKPGNRLSLSAYPAKLCLLADSAGTEQPTSLFTKCAEDPVFN
jgi:hypothetical protein